MRASSLISLAVLALTSGCGRGPEETGRVPSVPARDLTLEPSPEGAVQVASPLEAPRPRAERTGVQRPRRRPRPAPAPSPQPATPDAAPAAAVAEAARRPTAEAMAADPHALLPGQTVTVIPANSGPSVGSDPAAAPPSRAGRAILIGRGHGGTCQPRGAMQ